MLFIPFPWVLAEIVIFVMAVQRLGFLNTLGLYILPCFVGLFIVSVVGRVALMSIQSSLMKGQLPAGKIMNSGAIFISGLLLMVPSFFTRVGALILLLPGLRHLVIWQVKKYIAKRSAQGLGGFSFRSSGFRYYESSQERDVHEANVLDVTPLEIHHEAKKKDDDEGAS